MYMQIRPTPLRYEVCSIVKEERCSQLPIISKTIMTYTMEKGFSLGAYMNVLCIRMSHVDKPKLWSHF